MIIRPVFNIKCEDCVYSSKQPGGLILCSVPEGKCYKFHEEEIPPQTNGDRIRVMTNEELASLLWETSVGCPGRPGHWLQWQCPIKGTDKPCDGYKCWLNWLNAEAGE